MENILEDVILGGGADEDIEFVIMNNILINRDEEGQGPPFELENLSDEEVVKNFRFQRGHLQRIKNVFLIPDEVVTEAGDRVNGLKALCIVLKRLAYPSRLIDLKTFFNMSAQSLSQVIRTTVDIMIAQKGDLLLDLNLLQWLDRQKLESYAQAILAKGTAINNCWGFIDGTARAMCRPSINQEEYYSGHKFHCLKYQSVFCPDGIITILMGAFPGRRHDAGIFRESNLYQQLEEKVVFGENDKFVLFGDQGYGLMELLITPFPG
ncbi:uncharacterized protein [Leptinotarsa decemlineata]|uniref:uncharacterized protein n=1 Tax=Leptinotarsa decemlineata TaxID=7539 RepID=UPI003D30945B